MAACLCLHHEPHHAIVTNLSISDLLMWSDTRNMLQCAAVCCSVLQCFTVCCNVLQCVAVCCSPTHEGRHSECVAVCCVLCVWCSVLQCSEVCCSVLQCVVMCIAVCCSLAHEGTHAGWDPRHIILLPASHLSRGLIVPTTLHYRPT